MKKNTKRTAAALLSAAMLLGLISGCSTPGGPVESDKPAVELSYPVEPEELGSGTPKWTEEKTADGWMKVTNENGVTLGYSADSGMKLVQHDGYAFKDLNRNGKLDLYEDWRQDADARANDLVPQLPVESIFNLMWCLAINKMEDDGSDATAFMSTDKTTYQRAYLDSQSESLLEAIDMGVRVLLTYCTGYPVATQATLNNHIQSTAEASDAFGIPVLVYADPSGGVANLALAATFDPETAKSLSMQTAKKMVAMGFGQILGPQIDIAAEPRWSRVKGTFGEDPALSRDMAKAAITGFQSTYDEDGNDIGWGKDSVMSMMKHFPSDGAAEDGREAHNEFGKFNVYPGDGFSVGLVPFIDGGLNLDSATEEVSAVMVSYSIAYTEDGHLGENVGSAFSDYKVQLLRSYGFDGVISTDGGATTEKPWGVEELSEGERAYKAINAGIDHMMRGRYQSVEEAYQMFVDDIGEEAALARFQESARRILRNNFRAGLFENSYADTAASVAQDKSEEVANMIDEFSTRSIVMLKNENNVIKAAEGEKPTVYIPMVFKNTWSLPVSDKAANQYFNVVTDTVGEPTGPADDAGKATYTEKDIIRAGAEELAGCDFALVFTSSPASGNGWDAANKIYKPISLQYGDYTADSSSVRDVSIAGNMVTTEVESPYGMVSQQEQENRSYYGESISTTNASDLQMILDTAAKVPQVVVAVNASSSMVFSEFESEVDSILVGFGIDNDKFLSIAAGKNEPSGLLPIQMPANMETVEAQFEDMPRDMECHVDASGNTYDFGFGLNWSGVISDARTAKYCVEALTEPVNQPVK